MREGAGGQGLGAAGRRLIDPAALVVVLFVVFWWWLTLAVQGSPSDWAFDFRQFWQGAHDVVHGVSPYPSSELLATAGAHLQPEGIREVFRFPYPAGALVVLTPFGLLGFHTAAAVWSAVSIIALLASVWIVGARDWRVLAIVVVSAPVISSVRLGTLTPFLMLLLAVAWRWRDRTWVVACALGAAVALKILLWPMVVWLAATRRWLAAGATFLIAALVTLGAWAAIGFDGMTEYPTLLRRLSEIVADRGFSLVAVAVEAGMPREVADTLPWVAAVPLLGWAILLGRRARDPETFSVCVLAAVVLTPVVWLHYFALLVIPLAIVRPRFSWTWLLMLLFWITPYQTNDGDLWRIVVVLLTTAAIAGVFLRPRGSESRMA